MIFKKDKIKVLFISHKDFAGSGVKLSQALNKHSNKYQSRFVAMKSANYGGENDIVTPNNKKIQKLINLCDIIHLKGDNPVSFYKRLDLTNKPIFQTVGGSSFRKPNNPNYPSEVCLNKYDIKEYDCVNLSSITPELTDVWIPHAIEVKDNVWKKPNGVIRIGHSPSDRVKKGTDILLEALKEIEGIELVLMENMTNKEVIETKKSLHLFVDQLFIDAYGMSAVECLAMGIPVISSRMDLKGCPVYRIEQPTKEHVKEVVLKAISELSQKSSDLAYKWAKEVHSFDAVCLKLEQFYNQENKIIMSKKQSFKVDFFSNGTFFKEGVSKMEVKHANYMESKGYGHVVKTKETEPIEAPKPKEKPTPKPKTPKAPKK